MDVTQRAANGNNPESRDKPLSFHWKAANDDWVSDLGVPAPKSGRAREAVASILLDAWVEAITTGRWISYSRRKEFYTGQQRYQGTAYSFSTVPPAIDMLAERGLIEHEKAEAKRPRQGEEGRQSRFRAAPAMLGMAPPMFADQPGELIRLKGPDKRLVDYRDTAATERMRLTLCGVNDNIGATALRLEVPGAVVDGPVARLDSCIIHTGRYALHRVFNLDFQHGGRLYGGWWQGVPSAARSSITINGAATVERDYPQHHARLLYRMAGLQWPANADAYEVPGYEREVGKVAFQTLLNAPSYGAAVGAVAKKLGGEHFANDHRAAAVLLIDALKARHAPVAGYFHRDYGRRLQRVDSDICERVLVDLQRRGIVALPIHDSFIVQARHRGALDEAMETAFAAARFG